MAFGLESEGFWGKKEISYQHVHMFYGFWIGYIAFYIYSVMFIPAVCGFVCGCAMEFYQYRKYISSVTWPRTWLDSIRDLCFWTLGGCLNYIIIFLR
jgi:hypothetical protein